VEVEAMPDHDGDDVQGTDVIVATVSALPETARAAGTGAEATEIRFAASRAVEEIA
jgi:hypothetical protein